MQQPPCCYTRSDVSWTKAHSEDGLRDRCCFRNVSCVEFGGCERHNRCRRGWRVLCELPCMRKGLSALTLLGKVCKKYHPPLIRWLRRLGAQRSNQRATLDLQPKRNAHLTHSPSGASVVALRLGLNDSCHPIDALKQGVQPPRHMLAGEWRLDCSRSPQRIRIGQLTQQPRQGLPDVRWKLLLE